LFEIQRKAMQIRSASEEPMITAPIALFTYNRPQHTRQTLDALRGNDLASKSDLFVFSDAPKKPESLPAVLAIRDYLKTITGFKSVTVVERTVNFGLAKSIIDGVTDVCNKYGNVIVLEDDLVTSPYFLKFMNDALAEYAEEEKIISIHGYIYPVQENLPETFFLRGADCWGWATWKRGWDLFQPDAEKLYEAVQAGGEIKTFDFEGNYSYADMLKQQIDGKVNSWAIRWYASAFLANKLTLYPGISLVQNIGNDSSGTHCGDTDAFTGKIATHPIQVGDIPIMASQEAYNIVSRYFKSLKLPLMQRVRNKIRSLRTQWSM
jgi:hypothetical protein